MALRLLSTVSVLCLLAVSGHAAEPLSPRVEVGMKGGTDRSLLTTEFWAPLAQKSDRVLYGDIRLMGDNDENREGNLGLGYRQIHNNAVLGVHGWIDRRRTQNNSTFHQVTFGAERLGHVVDARANVYVPLNQSRNITTPNIGQASPYLAGTGIFYDTNGLLTETPQYGLDGEVGYRLPVFQKQVDAIRVYGGGYHFFRDETHDVTGFRVRTEAQINSAFSVGARFQHDDPRGSQGFLEATIKFPFGAKKLYQNYYLRARLDESPERDVDIVTAARQIDTGLGKQVINTTSGEVQRVLHVDNSNTQSGDGSKENPFNTLKAAELALQDNDVIYVNHGSGTTMGMDQGINISRNNISLIGSGSNFVWDNNKFTSLSGDILPSSGFIIKAATAAPVITNTQAFIDDGKGAGTSYTGNGIFVTGNNVSISGLTVSGASAGGIYVLQENGGSFNQNVTIKDVTSSNNLRGRGIFVNTYGTLDTVVISSSFANHNAGTHGRGIEVRSQETGKILSLSVDNNQALQNAQGGLYVIANGSSGSQASIEEAYVYRNIAQNNNTQGLLIQSSSSGKIGKIIAQDNMMDQNAHQAIIVTATGAGSIVEKVDISHNAVKNSLNGLVVQAISAGKIDDASITSNQVEKITNSAILAVANGLNSQIGHVLADQNITKDNISNGILIQSISAGYINKAEATDNTAIQNMSTGIYVQSDGAGSKIDQVILSGNTIQNNNNYGLIIQSSTAGQIDRAYAQNNTITKNVKSGIYIVATGVNSKINDTFIEDNTSQENQNHGIAILTSGSAAELSRVLISENNLTLNINNGITIEKQSISNVINADLGGGSLNSVGNNIIHSNVGNDVRLSLVNGGNVSAQHNYWGGGNLTRLTANTGSTIDTANYLTTVP